MLRDYHDIIIQEGADDPSWHDGGDSAFSTGIMSGCGSFLDHRLLPLFIKDGKLVRHPFQSTNTGDASHDDPRSTSRDQVICFFFGLYEWAETDNIKPVFEACRNYAKSWRVNRDVLNFAEKYYLYKVSDTKPPAWLFIPAHINILLDILFAAFIIPDHEKNQMICKTIVFGKRYFQLLNFLHRRLGWNIKNYYCGWRRKRFMAKYLIGFIKKHR